MSLFYRTPDLNLRIGSDPIDSLRDFIINDLGFGDSVDSLMDLIIDDWDFGDSDVPDLNLSNGSDPVDSLMDMEWEGIGDVIDGDIEELPALLRGEDENYVLPSASNAVVENLDSVLITQQDVDNDKVTCAVCTDDMNVGDMAKQLSCFHRYHGDCILPWLTRLELT